MNKLFATLSPHSSREPSLASLHRVLTWMTDLLVSGSCCAQWEEPSVKSGLY